MSEETADMILNRIEMDLDSGDRIQFIFQGGEPTLAGLPFFRGFIGKVKKWNKDIEVSYALQTNGLFIGKDWCEFLKENNFLVGVSLDILSDCHDEVRIDAEGKGTYKRVINTISLFDKYGVEYNVLCTLTNSVARYPQKVWNRIIQLGIKYVQFTPCLGELNLESTSPYALTPKRFTSFYTAIFNLWYDSYKNGRVISIKLFDDILNLMVLGRPTLCGMNGTCQPQLVVEADGSVYPCDFYCLDEYKLGNLKENGVFELLSGDTVQKFADRPHKRPELCNSCQYLAFCGGNCKRMQKEICCTDNDNYCGYRDFLDNCGAELNKIANEIIHKTRRC